METFSGKNTLFEVTRWHFDTRSEKNRRERGESEEKWQEEWNKKFHKDFDISVGLNTLEHTSEMFIASEPSISGL